MPKVLTLSSRPILKDFPMRYHMCYHIRYHRFILNSTGTEHVTTRYHHIIKKKVLISFDNI